MYSIVYHKLIHQYYVFFLLSSCNALKELGLAYCQDGLILRSGYACIHALMGGLILRGGLKER